VIGKSDCVRGHVKDTDRAEPAAPVLSEQAYRQDQLDRAGLGIRLRGGAPSWMSMGEWLGRRDGVPPSSEPAEAQRPAA
jgi:hypothetical protein